MLNYSMVRSTLGIIQQTQILKKIKSWLNKKQESWLLILWRSTMFGMEEAEVSSFSHYRWLSVTLSWYWHLLQTLKHKACIRFKDIQKVCDRFEVNRKATAVDQASYLQRRRGRYLWWWSWQTIWEHQLMAFHPFSTLIILRMRMRKAP